MSLLIFFLSLVSFSATVKQAELYSVACRILDKNGTQVRQYPGLHCRYLPDGRVLSFKNDQIRVYDLSGQRVWRVRGHFHHYATLSSDLQTVFVLSSSIHKVKGEQVRFDRISQYDLVTGKEIAFFDFYDHQKELLDRTEPKLEYYLNDAPYDLQLPPSDATAEEKKAFLPTKKEFSHANSVQEIPANALEEKNSAFKKGHILVNVNSLGLILILDPTLKKILWSMSTVMTSHSETNVHDAQLLESGKILIYNNIYKPGFSAIEEIDPLTKKRTLIYKAVPPDRFFSTMQGGVQKLESGNYLISEFTPGKMARYFEIEPKGGKTVWTTNVLHDGKIPGGMQDVKKFDLTGFLKKNLNLWEPPSQENAKSP